MESDLIYDVGMNTGHDTDYYLSRGYRVVAIEADPHFVAEYREKQAEHIRSGQLRVLNYVIGPEDGTARFWLCQENAAMSTMDERTVRSSGLTFQPMDLPCRRLSSILREHGVPFYLKVDIEGSDHYCLEDIDPTDAPMYVSFEILRLHDLFLLHSKGYDAFKCIDQETLTQLTTPDDRSASAWSVLKGRVKPLLERRPWLYEVARSPSRLKAALSGTRRTSAPADAPILTRGEWQFVRGDTGPFGEDTDGCWQQLDDVAYAWLTWRRGAPGRAGWFDIHAARGRREPVLPRPLQARQPSRHLVRTNP
jgi:FkbM family methyltransferase